MGSPLLLHRPECFYYPDTLRRMVYNTARDLKGYYKSATYFSNCLHINLTLCWREIFISQRICFDVFRHPTISTDISFQIKRVKLFYFCQVGWGLPLAKKANFATFCSVTVIFKSNQSLFNFSISNSQFSNKLKSVRIPNCKKGFRKFILHNKILISSLKYVRNPKS